MLAASYSDDKAMRPLPIDERRKKETQTYMSATLVTRTNQLIIWYYMRDALSLNFFIMRSYPQFL